jgi:hypothetical protein
MLVNSGMVILQPALNKRSRIKKMNELSRSFFLTIDVALYQPSVIFCLQTGHLSMPY